MKKTLISAIDYNVYLNRNGYTNSKGCRQVVVELYQQGCRRIVNTHIHVREADFHSGRIQTTHPDHDLLNRRIRRIVRGLMELEDEALDVLWTGKALNLIRRYGSLEALADIGNNKKCNHDLRDIAEKAGIKRHLHWHLSRHTCATLLNQHGLNMQEIQFILGHSKLATTEKHYAETLYQQVKLSLAKAF